MPDPVWKQKLDRLTGLADRRRLEVEPVDYHTAMVNFEAVIQRTKELWGSTKAEKWPAVQSKDIKTLINNATTRARKARDPWLALTMLGLAEEELEARSRLQVDTALALKDAYVTLTNLSARVEDLVPDHGPEPEGIEKLRNPLATSLERHEAAKRDFRAGLWNRAHAEAIHSQTVCKQVTKKLSMWHWRGSMTLDLQQGGYTMHGMDESLLSQIESEGVCLALALDWLGGGDLKGDGVQDGRVAMKHRFWQAGYTLDSPDDSDDELRAKALKLAGMLGKTEGLDKVKAARDQTKATLLLMERELEQKVQQNKVFRNQVKEWSKVFVDAKAKISRIDETRKDTDEPLWKESERAKLVIERDLAMTAMTNSQKDLRTMDSEETAQREFVAKLREELERLEKAVVDEEEVAISDHYPAMQKMAAKHRELQRQWDLAAPGGGVRVPSRMMQDMGVKLVKDGTIPTRPLGTDFLTEGQIRQALEMVADAEPGSPHHYQIAVYGPPGGHAMALKVSRSKAPDRVLTLEFFDPNHGAFSLSTLERLQRLVLDIWGSWGKQWTALTTMKMEPTGTGSPEVIDPGEPLDLFDADMVVLEDGLQRVQNHPGVPPRLKPQFTEIITKIRKLRPTKRDDEFGHLEFKRARVHMQETRTRMEKVLLDGDGWLALKRQCAGIDPIGNPDHVLVANAVKLATLSWTAGNVDRAMVQLAGAVQVLLAPVRFDPVDLDTSDDIIEGPLEGHDDEVDD